MYVTSGQKSLLDGFFRSAYREYGVPDFGRKQVDPKLFSGLHQSEVTPFLQIKSTLINAWRSEAGKPLKHLNAVIRVAEGGGTLVSFGAPFVRMLRPDESAEGALTLNSKWRRSLEAELKSRGIDPNEVLKSMDIDV